MKKIAAVLLMMFMLFAGSQRAEAVNIVYTGPANSSTLTPTPWNLNTGLWLSAEFEMADDYVITDVMGWISSADDSTTAHISIYSDGGDNPGSTQHFTQQFTVSQSPELGGWYGLSGLSWSLSAGTYWVAYEVWVGDTLNGGMRHPPASPLGNEAFFSTSAASWSGYDLMDIGVWIEGTTASVPEPATWLLLGSGMLGFGLFRRAREEG